MSDKRYYWIKLNRDFFNTNEVKYLMSKVGDIGILTYQKLILYSADTDGKIEVKGLFDGDISKEIALYVNAEPEHVEAVFDALEELGMIAKNPDSITISGVSEMVGSETDKAHMMRKIRQKRKDELNGMPLIEDYQNELRYGGNYYTVLERDGKQCAVCGSKDNLCIHHIDGYDPEKPGNNDANKLITLCRSCHAIVHRGYGNIFLEKVLNKIGYYESERVKQ